MDDTQPQSRTEGSTESPVSMLARHEWTIVGLVALLAFLLGILGYSQTMTFEHQGGSHTRWDAIYASLQLFIFEGPDATAGWPIHLQIARALAPMVLLYTAAVAIFSQLESRVALYRLLFRKRRFVRTSAIIIPVNKFQSRGCKLNNLPLARYSWFGEVKPPTSPVKVIS